MRCTMRGPNWSNRRCARRDATRSGLARCGACYTDPLLDCQVTMQPAIAARDPTKVGSLAWCAAKQPAIAPHATRQGGSLAWCAAKQPTIAAPDTAKVGSLVARGCGACHTDRLLECQLH